MSRRRWPSIPGLQGEIENLNARITELEKKFDPPAKKKSVTPTRIERKIAKAKEKEARN